MENKNCQLVCNLLYINANNFQSKKKNYLNSAIIFTQHKIPQVSKIV